AAALFLKFRPMGDAQDAAKPAKADAAAVARSEPTLTAPVPPLVPQALSASSGQVAIQDTSRIAVPPPVEEAPATAKSGCHAYEDGHTSEAATILNRVLAKTPGDADALFCLCGADARKGSLAADEAAVCERFLAHAPQGDERRRQVRMWL